MDRFFVVGKIIWFIIQPLNFVAILAALAALATWRNRVRAARLLITLVAAALIMPLLIPLDRMLLAPLETRFPAAELPAKVDGVLLLGGAQRTVLTKYYRVPELNAAAETLTTFLALARRYPNAKLVFSGGTGDLRHPELSEVDTVKLFLREQQFDASKIIFEGKSRNTYENAVYTKALVKPQPGETWLVITNARTAPRAMGIFRKVGWEVTIVPRDHLVIPDSIDWVSFNVLDTYVNLSWGLYEWSGLAAYYLTGRTSAFFPAP
jgi:uncharacterized SAM-binding protein YcdF (DUF218 family)